MSFNLQLNTLEPDVAAAVQRGAAALLLRGSRARSRPATDRSVRAGGEGSPHNMRYMRRLASTARRSPRFPMGKSEIVRYNVGKHGGSRSSNRTAFRPGASAGYLRRLLQGRRHSSVVSVSPSRPHVHDEHPRLHFGEQIDDIEIVDGIEIANGALDCAPRPGASCSLRRHRRDQRCPLRESTPDVVGRFGPCPLSALLRRSLSARRWATLDFLHFSDRSRHGQKAT